MKKIFAGILISVALLAMNVGSAFAQSTTSDKISGTVNAVEIATNSATGETVVKLDLTLEDGSAKTVTVSLETAVALGLVTVDPATNEPSVSPDAVNTVVEIDSSAVMPDSEDGEEAGANHPVGALLASFFGESTGVDYDTIMQYHSEGAGFGVIAQALWMTSRMEGSADMFGLILDAKMTGDYSGITLPDGSTPANWGQFKKAVMGGGGMSVGHVKQELNGKGNPNKDGAPGKGNNGGNGKGNGNGKP